MSTNGWLKQNNMNQTIQFVAIRSQIDVMVCSPHIYHCITSRNLWCLFHESLLLDVETYLPSVPRYRRTTCQTLVFWQWAEGRLLPASSLPSHFAEKSTSRWSSWGKMPCCCEEDGRSPAGQVKHTVRTVNVISQYPAFTKLLLCVPTASGKSAALNEISHTVYKPPGRQTNRRGARV